MGQDGEAEGVEVLHHELPSPRFRRWEIGEVASRIGHLYYACYLRTTELHSLIGAYVFYKAIYSRGYFGAAAAGADDGGSGGDGCRHQAFLIQYKELRFIKRFLVVALLMRRAEAVDHLAGRLRARRVGAGGCRICRLAQLAGGAAAAACGGGGISPAFSVNSMEAAQSTPPCSKRWDPATALKGPTNITWRSCSRDQ